MRGWGTPTKAVEPVIPCHYELGTSPNSLGSRLLILTPSLGAPGQLLWRSHGISNWSGPWSSRKNNRHPEGWWDILWRMQVQYIRSALLSDSWYCGSYKGGKSANGIPACVRGGHPNNLELCVYSYMFKLQSPSKCSPFDAIHLSRCFFHCSKQFLNLSILMLFSASAGFLFFCLFVSPLLPWQSISLWGLFSSRETKKVAWGENRWIGRVGHGDHAVFGQKLLNTQGGVDS